MPEENTLVAVPVRYLDQRPSTDVPAGRFPGKPPPVAFCYTSARRANPKGVLYSHRSNVLHTLRDQCRKTPWAFRASEDVVLAGRPMFHCECLRPGPSAVVGDRGQHG